MRLNCAADTLLSSNILSSTTSCVASVHLGPGPPSNVEASSRLARITHHRRGQVGRFPRLWMGSRPARQASGLARRADDRSADAILAVDGGPGSRFAEAISHVTLMAFYHFIR